MIFRSRWGQLMVVGLMLSHSSLLLAQTVQLTGRVTAIPRKESNSSASSGAYGDRSLRYITLFDYKHLQNVVVYAEEANPRRTEKNPEQQTQFSVIIKKEGRNLKFSPPFLAASQGAKITFANQTRSPLTLFTKSGSADRFQMALEPNESKEISIETSGSYHLGCFEDPKAATNIFVAGSYLAMADSEGNYKIELPAGDYIVTAWHERFPAQSQEVHLGEVHLGPKERTELNFTLSVRQLPEIK